MSLFSPAHERFRAKARAFVEQSLRPHADEWESRRAFPRQIFKDLAREGLLGLTHPREYGGGGLDFGYSVVFAEELPRSRMMGLTLSVLAQTTFFAPLIAAFGTEELKQEFLVPAIRGDKIGGLASTEPTGGSDLIRAVQCTAVDDGDSWLITGEKKFITNGPIADFLVVLVRTRPEPSTNSLSLVIVPTDLPGFRVKETLRTLGLHTSPTGWLEFDGCRVPKSLTLGKPHLGFFYLQNFLEERLISGVVGVSAAEMVLGQTITYLQGRMAFDQRLADLQVVRHRVSEMAADIAMLKRFVYSVCESYRDGRVEGKAICMIKFLAADIVQRVVERCLQLHGGYGFLEDNWLTRVYRDARLLGIGGGASELMKDLVASYLRV